jgi:hypothetical protein
VDHGGHSCLRTCRTIESRRQSSCERIHKLGAFGCDRLCQPVPGGSVALPGASPVIPEIGQAAHRAHGTTDQFCNTCGIRCTAWVQFPQIRCARADVDRHSVFGTARVCGACHE